MTPSGRLQSLIEEVSGFLVLVLQSVPSWGIYVPFMTFPVVGYFVYLFLTFPFGTQEILLDLFFGFNTIDFLLRFVGFGLIIYAIVHRRKRIGNGLVRDGPYGWVRHPQYLGFVMTTLGFTFGSYWILNNTFGIGWLSRGLTLLVWFVELVVYVILANIEELHLSKRFQENYRDYRNQVSFFIPLLNTRNRSLDSLLAVVLPSVLLVSLVLLIP